MNYRGDRFRCYFLIFIALGLFSPIASRSFQEPFRQLPNLDQRKQAVRPVGDEQAQAAAQLKARVPRVRIDRDEITGAPKFIGATDGFLSGPNGAGRGISAESLGAVPTHDPHRQLKAFLREHAALFGHGPEALASARLKRDYVAAHNGLRTLAWEQHLDNIPVYEAVLAAHLTAQGELVNVSSQFLPNLEKAALAGAPNRAALEAAPPISVRKAIRIAAENIGEFLAGEPMEEKGGHFQAAPLPGLVRAKLVWLPMSGAELRLCWQIELTRRAGGERYRLLLDVEKGEVLVRRCLTFSLTEATYRVWTSDSPSPFSPGYSSPTTNQPPLTSRSLVTLAALSTNASPLGWINDGANETRGNNVDAHLDWNADDRPDLPRPQGSPFRVFDFPLDLSQAPTNYGPAAVVQLFYWCNWMHDSLYGLGFTEAAGNFQKDNFGRGGLDNDGLQADAQDGSGFNNSNFTVTEDGESPRMQMYQFNGPEPARDGDLDAEVILHEYTHGLSDRLVGGGAGLSALQSIGLAEGWSDFYGLALLSQPGDDVEGVYVAGGYASFGFKGLTENYYFGIRRYPYTTDLWKNPLTFKDIDPAQIDPHSQAPANPIWTFNPAQANEVHDMGEVWCVTLWEARANLIRKYGFAVGNQLILQLVTDGMKLSPPNPNFLQARDAILQADLVNQGGANWSELWGAFAKRGMGVSASSPASITTAGIREAYDLPDALLVLPLSPFFASGPPGGPLMPACSSYSLTNHSLTSLVWQAVANQPWLRVTPAGGTLASGAGTNVVVCLTTNAASLPLGYFPATIIFSNSSSGVVQSREMRLDILNFLPLPFEENFENGALSAAWLATGTGPFRTQVVSEQREFSGSYQLLLDTAVNGVYARNELTLGLDLGGYTNVTLRFWAKSFGDDPHGPPPSPFMGGADFDGVAISTDGVIWYEVIGLRNFTGFFALLGQSFIVNLDEAVAAHGLQYGPTFRIRFNHYDDYQPPYDGIAIDDISINGVPWRRFAVLAPGAVAEGEGVLMNAGKVSLAAPASAELRFVLHSSDPSKIVLPASVIIPAGAMVGAFNISVIDNGVRDGTQPVTISASAQDYIGQSAIIMVSDNETGTVKIKLPPKTTEGAGVLAGAGKLQVIGKMARDLAVQLSSSAPSLVQVPPTITIPAGADSARFDLVIGNDLALEGPQAVTIIGHVEHWKDGQDTILVQDNDRPGLTLEVPSQANEIDGVLAGAGRVQLLATLPTNLVVSLYSSNVSAVTVPDSVTVPAGQIEARFNLNIFDNTVVDGTRTVWLAAKAGRFGSASAAIILIDDETPPVPSQPNPPDLAENVPLTPTLNWQGGSGEIVVNGGFETGDFMGWQKEDVNYGAFVINDGKFDPEGPDGPLPPFEGKYCALSQQTGGGTHTVYQDVTIPADAKSAMLSWADRIRNQASAFSPDTQEFRVEIRDMANQVLAVPFTTKPGDALQSEWTRRSYDLTIYRGRQLRLAFVEKDFLGYLNVHLDSVSLQLGACGGLVYDVYFGTNTQPGAAEFQGTSASPRWSLPPLPMNTTFYWQIISKCGAAQMPGPVWQFTTRGVGKLDHLAWGQFPTPQIVEQAFPVTIRAEDDLNNCVTNYSGTVALRGLIGADTRAAVVITEIDTASNDRVEFANVTGRLLDISGWQISLYDGRYWPAPRCTFTVPANSFCPPGDLFTLVVAGTAPGAYPKFVAGTNLSWNTQLISNQVAVLVRDNAGNIVDFVCASEGYASQITNPIPIPRSEWRGNPIPGNTNIAYTFQRIGWIDNGDKNDWVVRASSFALRNPGLDIRFASASPISLFPAASENFVNGIWQGAMTIHQLADGLRLVADDGYNHFGYSAPFSVVATNNLGVSLLGSPDVDIAGNDLTYTITVTNTGPEPALDVSLVDMLPDGAAFVSANTPQGSCSNVAGELRCSLGTLAAGASVSLTVVVIPANPGYLTNTVRVTRLGADFYTADNTAVAVNTVNLPLLTVSPINVTGASAGTVTAVFQVRLSAACKLPVSVEYATTDGSAIADEDYLAQSGLLIFQPGVTSQPVTVTILGDSFYEETETFFLNLFAPTNASLLVSQARCRITENRPRPTVFINDVTVREPLPGNTTSAVFAVRLSEPAGTTVSVSFTTSNQTAVAGREYIGTAGVLVFPPGVTNQAISVSVLGLPSNKTNAAFWVTLSGPVNALLGRLNGICTILDNGFPELHHFVWSPLPSPQFAGVPFTATIAAQDQNNAVFNGFNGAVNLRAYTQSRQVSIGTGSGLWENPLGTLYHDGRTQVIYLADELGGAGEISALSMNVAAVPGQTLSNWTIRLKTTALSNYATAAWEGSGWATAYQRNEPAPDPGWVMFYFATPFWYDGTNNLMIDFSFNNDSYSANGQCRATQMPQARSISFHTDSAFGDPLAWAGSQPPPVISKLVPNIRLLMEDSIAVTPSGSGQFTQGLWTGDITLQAPGTNVILRAIDDSGHVGLSMPLIVQQPTGIGIQTAESVLRITSFSTSTQDAVISFASLPGKTYAVEWAKTPQGGLWAPLTDDLPGTGAIIHVIDPVPAPQSSRYYRVRVIP